MLKRAKKKSGGERKQKVIQQAQETLKEQTSDHESDEGIEVDCRPGSKPVATDTADHDVEAEGPILPLPRCMCLCTLLCTLRWLMSAFTRQCSPRRAS
jgi:hypothetical protein